jgi:methylamine dehydrogenase accessory protein MauD
LDGLWLGSYIALWIVVVCLGLLALSHSRLLGLMYQRIGPGVARPLPEGPAVGTRIDEIEAITVHGAPWSRRFPIENESIVIFVSPQCQACSELIPHVKDFLGRLGSRTDLYLLSVLGDAAMNRAYVEYAKLHNTPYLIADSFARRVQVSGTPYGFKLDKNGTILAKGVVNHFEHLASLWNVTSSDDVDSAARASDVQKEDVIA